MSLAEAFAPVEAANRSIVMHATWGHLAPTPRKRYPGTILFTQSAYGNLVPIRADFEGLDDSPWFFEALNDFVAENATTAGEVYKFIGTCMLFKNGKFRFSGKVQKVKC